MLRKNTHNPEMIEKWFRKLLACKEEYRVADCDIYNMDEMGFRISVSRSYKILTRSGNKRERMTDPDNRDYITLIKVISTTGIALPLILVVKAAHL
jgi:hypothetical protein